MKTRNLLAATLAAVLALAGCSKNDEPGEETRDIVQITTTICATADNGNASNARATIGADGSGSFATGDELGLYAYVGSEAKLTNSSYKVNETALYWDDLSEIDPVTFAAYYPKAATIANPEAYAFNAATATDKDLLVATPVSASKGETVTLNFRHAMHRLVVNLTTDIDGWDAATATVTPTGMNAAATVDILTGTVTAGEADEADGDYGTQTGATTTFILAPQQVDAGADWIQIAIGGKTFTYAVPAQYTTPGGGTAALTALESGKTLTLNLAVTRDGVTLTSGEIAAWDSQGTIDGEIDLGGDTPTGEIDMANKTAAEVKAAIQAALTAGFTELKLTGPIANSGIGGVFTGTFWQNTTVTKIDLTEVTGWEAVNYWGDATKGDAIIGLPAYAFYDCTSLTEIKLPAAVKAIGTAACSSCTALTTINLGEVTHIGQSAFEKCGKLASVNLAKATTLYGRAFTESGLTAVTLPVATAVSVGSSGASYGSFSSCAQLASIQAPALEQTGIGTFDGCKILTTVDMPALKGIGEGAFNNCKSLKEIGLSQVTILGTRAFLGCTALETLNLPAATKFDNYFVSGCNSLKVIKVTAAGAFVNSEGYSLGEEPVFDNMTGSQTPFVPSECALTLNNDKQPGNSGTPTVENDNSWARVIWKSISYTE